MARSSRSATKLTVECLEDRTVPAFLPRTGVSPALVNGAVFPTPPSGGLSIAVGDVIPEAFGPTRNEYVLGTGPGTPGLITVYDQSGTLLRAFLPFGGYSGGLSVAVGDVTGDSQNEIVVGTAGSGPSFVGVFNSAGAMLSAFLAYPTNYQDGVNIAVANVIPAPGQTLAAGAPGQPGAKSEIIVGANTAPAVTVFDGGGAVRRSFVVFGGVFPIGANVAAASVDNNRSSANPLTPDTNAYAEIIVGAASALPLVQVYNTSTSATAGPLLVEQYLAFDLTNPANFTGVTVAAGNTDFNLFSPDTTRGAEVFVSLNNGSRIRTFSGDTATLRAEVVAFPSEYSRVVNMAVGNVFGFFSGATADLAVVAGDGPFQQQPRIFFGVPSSPAGLNGP